MKKQRTVPYGGRIITVSRGFALDASDKLVPHLFVDAADEQDASYSDKVLITEWIKKNLLPSKFVLEYHTSYTLKHIIERDLGIYMTNNQMKCFMRDCGFYPVDAREKNWRYRISSRSPAFLIDEINRVGRDTYRAIHRNDSAIPMT